MEKNKFFVIAELILGIMLLVIGSINNLEIVENITIKKEINHEMLEANTLSSMVYGRKRNVSKETYLNNEKKVKANDQTEEITEIYEIVEINKLNNMVYEREINITKEKMGNKQGENVFVKEEVREIKKEEKEEDIKKDQERQAKKHDGNRWIKAKKRPEKTGINYEDRKYNKTIRTLSSSKEEDN